MIVDGHVHVFAEWPHKPSVPDPAVRGSATELLRKMDEAGVAQALVIASNNPGNPENNTYVLSACRQNAGRLHPLLFVEPSNDAAFRVFDQALGARAAGLAIVPQSDADLLGVCATHLFARMAEHGLILNIATWPERGAQIAALAGQHPALHICWNEMGNARVLRRLTRDRYLRLIEPIADTTNVHLKVSGLPRIATDAWEYPFRRWRWLVEDLLIRLGADRLIWGSEFPGHGPAITYRQTLEFLRAGDWTTIAYALPRLLGGNAQRLLAGSQRQPTCKVESKHTFS